MVNPLIGIPYITAKAAIGLVKGATSSGQSTVTTIAAQPSAYQASTTPTQASAGQDELKRRFLAASGGTPGSSSSLLTQSTGGSFSA